MAKEGLESLSADRDVNLVLYLTLVLLLLEKGDIFQEGGCKCNSVQARGTGNGEVIFALLEEIVTLQVSFTLINIREPSFQRPLTWPFIVQSGGNDGDRNKCRRSKIQNGFKDLLEVILQVSNHGGVNGARNSKQSNNRCSSGSKSMCRDGSRDATVAIFGGDFANKLVFAVVKILARIAMSERSSHGTSWVGASKKAFERS